MNCDEYQALSARTEADAETARLRLTPFGTDHPVRLLHALVGMVTEVGELTDVLKKYLYYGKPIDTANMDEEVGDLLWYVALYCNARGVKLGDLMAANVAKLRARYPEKFTEHDALNRDLSKEKAALGRVGGIAADETSAVGDFRGPLEGGPCPACDHDHLDPRD